MNDFVSMRKPGALRMQVSVLRFKRVGWGLIRPVCQCICVCVDTDLCVLSPL